MELRTRAKIAGLALAVPGVLLLGAPGYIISVLVVGIALLLGGEMIEELGRMKRIRQGLALQLFACLTVLGAVVGAGLLRSLHALPWDLFGFFFDGLGGAMAVSAGYVALGRLFDTRFMRAFRLDTVAGDGLKVVRKGQSVLIPWRTVFNVLAGENSAGRGALVIVRSEPALPEPLKALPWQGYSPDGSILAFKEQELGMDVDEFLRAARAFVPEPPKKAEQIAS